MIAKYSDELANGDSADDRDIHEDEDMNDDVVDVNGGTNAGYGALYGTQENFFNINHIEPGSFLTDPSAVQLEDETLLQVSAERSQEELNFEPGHWYKDITTLNKERNIGI